MPIGVFLDNFEGGNIPLDNIEDLNDFLDIQDDALIVFNSTSGVVISGVVSFPILTQKIKWITDIESDSQVKYGTTPLLGNTTIIDSTLVLVHNVLLTNLLSNKKYYYQVLSKDSFGALSKSGINTFHT